MSQKFDMTRYKNDYDSFVKAVSVTIITVTILLAGFALFLL
ncbi:MAG: hypothetical protein QM523_05285 [Candidatus Pacebacteria bacterium]|nr:hypothetical protein [Candidatus Paceibacterota bacterium]